MNLLNKVFILCGLIIILTFTGCFSDSETVNTTEPEDKTMPYSPSPSNGAVNQPTNLTLRWECDGAEYYDINWGQGSPNLKIASGIKDKYYPRPTHALNSVYYWNVTAHYSDGRSPVTGPNWKYTTQAGPGGTPSQNGFILSAYRVEEFLPSYVNVLFQVQDAHGKGVPGLNRDAFTLYDDYEVLAFQEHDQLINGAPNDLKIYTILMLDNSTSLTGKIGEIQREADEFVKNLIFPQNNTHYIAIYSFSADINKITPLTPKFTNNPAELNTAIYTNYKLGAMSTDLYGAFVVGGEEMVDVIDADSIRQSFLVVFTDGKDTQGSTPYISAKNATNYRKVYTLGFDDGPVPGVSYDPAVLQDLGTAGFFPVNDGAGLRDAFKEISKDITDFAESFYTLNYLSPREGPNNHVLRIEKTVNPIISFIQENYNSENFFHPEDGNVNVYLVDLSSNEWFEPGNHTIYNGTHFFQAVTYLGTQYPGDYEIEPRSAIVFDPYDETNSKFSISGVPVTLRIKDNNNGGFERIFNFTKK